MLSKLLRGADTGDVQTMVFPHVSRRDRDTSRQEERPRPEPGQDAEIARLRAKVQEIESRMATERRAAFEAGRQQGEQAAGEEIRPVLERLNASIAHVLSMRSDLRRRAERDTVELALQIAKRILHRQLSVDEGALTAIARVAFDRLTRAEWYRVTVHPRFAAAISAALPANGLPRVEFNPDPNCAPGTLIIHSEEGTIDASVGTQLEEISQGLTDLLAPPAASAGGEAR